MIITKEAPMTKAIPIQTALAVAFMADRLNNGYVKETRRFSEDVPTIFSNKEVVKFYFAEQDNFTPEDYVKAIPIDEDFDCVDIALKLSLIHISEPTRPERIWDGVLWL